MHQQRIRQEGPGEIISNAQDGEDTEDERSFQIPTVFGFILHPIRFFILSPHTYNDEHQESVFLPRQQYTEVGF